MFFCDVFLVDNQKGAVNHDRLFKQENFQRLFTSAAFWFCSFSLPTFFLFRMVKQEKEEICFNFLSVGS